MRALFSVNGPLWIRLAMGAIVAVGLVFVARAVVAQSNGVINACYNDRSIGQLRISDNCRRNETAISWNQIGPQGIQGERGPQGIQGEPGPQGPAGPSGGEPLLASVNSNGIVLGSPDVVSARILRTGTFVVQFERDITACHRVASLGRGLDPDPRGNPNIVNVPGGEVSTFNTGDPGDGSGGPDTIAVQTRDSAGNLANMSFHLAVFC